MLRRGEEASLTRIWYDERPFVFRSFIPLAWVTEANPAQATLVLTWSRPFCPATLRAIQRQRVYGIFTMCPLSGTPFQRLLVLFTVFFDEYEGDYMPKIRFVKEAIGSIQIV